MSDEKEDSNEDESSSERDALQKANIASTPDEDPRDGDSGESDDE
ncbi:hypothetical protein ACOZ35_03330 [Halorubrum xinjiangense]